MLADAIDVADLGCLLPMHLLLSAEGEIISSGPTLRKLAGSARRLEEAFAVDRPHPGLGGATQALTQAATSGARVFLRQRAAPFTLLRGHAVLLADGRLILNLGFGIGLPQSIGQLQLTDADFAPSDLAMELLFLHEANTAAMQALSRHNARLDQQRQAAQEASATDPLTGLANRRGLDRAMAAAVGRSALQGNEGPARRHDDVQDFSIAHLDLDGFKAVDDRFGHAAGDDLLRHVAQILREETRSTDTVARPGGDEFVILLEEPMSVAALGQLARRIIARIEAPVALAGVEMPISASIGLACSADYCGCDSAIMELDADGALYAAKRGGRGRAYRARGPGKMPVPVPVAAGGGAAPR